jgi:MFS family permease
LPFGWCTRSFISLWTAIGSLSSSVLFGYVGDRYGPQWSLIASGVVLALLPALLRAVKSPVVH